MTLAWHLLLCRSHKVFRLDWTQSQSLCSESAPLASLALWPVKKVFRSFVVSAKVNIYQWQKFMVVASVIVELDLADELNLDSIMFNFSCFSVESHIHLDEIHYNHVMNKAQILVPPFQTRSPRHRRDKISPFFRSHPWPLPSSWFLHHPRWYRSLLPHQNSIQRSSIEGGELLILQRNKQNMITISDDDCVSDSAYSVISL